MAVPEHVAQDDAEGYRAGGGGLLVPANADHSFAAPGRGHPLRRLITWISERKGRLVTFFAGLVVFIQTVGVNFLWPQFIAPLTIPPTIHFVATMKQLPNEDGQPLIPIELTFRFENFSGTRVKVVTAYYNLYGVRITPSGALRSLPTEELRRSSWADSGPAPSGVAWSDEVPRPGSLQVDPGGNADETEGALTGVPGYSEEYNHVLYQELLTSGTYFEPSEELTMTFIVYVAEDAYDKLSIFPQMAVAKNEVSVKGLDEGSGGWLGGVRDYIWPRIMIGPRCDVLSNEQLRSNAYICDIYKWSLTRDRNLETERINEEQHAQKVESTDDMSKDHQLAWTGAGTELSLWAEDPAMPSAPPTAAP